VPVLQAGVFPAPRLLETCSVDDENESDVKCDDEAQHGLVIKNQYDVGHLFKLLVHQHSLI
jgi:hypothetical protein